jgi:hypothetical protein
LECWFFATSVHHLRATETEVWASWKYRAGLECVTEVPWFAPTSLG